MLRKNIENYNEEIYKITSLSEFNNIKKKIKNNDKLEISL